MTRAHLKWWERDEGPRETQEVLQSPSQSSLWGEEEKGAGARGFVAWQAGRLQDPRPVMDRTGQSGGAAGLGELSLALALGQLSSEGMGPLSPAFLLSVCPE